MPAPEAANIYGVQIRESANDGSDFSNAATDYRILFLGEDGLLHVKDSAGAVSSPYTGGSPGLTLLEQHTASASATLDFTSFISSTYDEYVFELVNVIPATNGVALWMRMGTGAGPTYDTGNNYGWSSFVWRAAASGTAGAETGASKIQLGFSTGYSNVASDGGTSGTLRLFSPQSTTAHKQVLGMIYGYDTSVSFPLPSTTFGRYISTTALTAVQFLMSSGNIASGTIRVYGIAKS